MKRCEFLSRWGRCQQEARQAVTQQDLGFGDPVIVASLCFFHARWAFRIQQPDAWYHQAIVEGRLEDTDAYLTPAEIRALVNGRYHGDGRRLDRWVVDEPVEWDGIE